MAQLVAGILAAVQPRLFQPLFNHVVDCVRSHAGMLTGQKQGILIRCSQMAADRQPVLNRPLTGVVQIEHPLFVAFAQHSELFSSNIR